MDSSNLMELCRLCLDKDRVSIPIFEGEGVERKIFLKIGSCLPVKVSEDDPLPKKICDDCTYKVELVYSFWNTTANAEKQLLEWLGFRESPPEPTVEMPKTEMVLLKEESLEHEVNPEIGELREDSPGTAEETSGNREESDEESDGNEDPGGGHFSAEEGVSSMNVTVGTAPNCMTEAGPSGIQQQKTTTQPVQHTVQDQQPIPQQSSQPVPQTQPLLPLGNALPDDGDPAGFSKNTSGENGEKETPSNATEKLPCDQCGRSFSASSLPLHKRTHSLEKPCICTVCGVTFSHEKGLRSHMVSHSDVRPYSCDLCRRRFKRSNELTMHRKIHLGEKAHHCDLCDYSCVQKSNLVIHKKRHANEYKFTCDICDKGCYTNQELQKHRMTHMDIKYKCKDCGKEFGHKYGLTIHEKRHDPNYKPPIGKHQCELCGKTYVKQGGLKLHMRLHTGIKLHTCDICGKSVSSKGTLEVHYRIHTGEKPNICEVCGKMFSSKRYLDTHMRCHTGEKPFTCPECGKSFTQQSTLIVHQRYHTGRRPYKCPICDKGFVVRTQLKSHQKNYNHFQSIAQDTVEVPIASNEVVCEQETLDNTFSESTVNHNITLYGDLSLDRKVLYHCSVCEQLFLSRELLIQHQKMQCQIGLIKNEHGEPVDSDAD